MIITPDQDLTGVAFWTPATMSLDVLDAERRLVAQLTDSRGSPLPPIRGEVFFGFRGPGEAPTLRIATQDGSLVWNGDPTEAPIRFVWVPGKGHFRRIVLDAGNVGWPGDCVIRSDLTLVRLITGVVQGERAEPMNRLEINDNGTYSVTGERIGTLSLEGRFIEIVSFGNDAHEASANADAVTGLIGLLWGRNAVGGIVLDNLFDTTSGQQNLNLPVPLGTNFPLALSEHDSTELDLLLPGTMADTPDAEARRTALHWFAHGEAAESPRDQLLAYFVAIEAIVSSRSSSAKGDSDRIALRKKVLAATKTALTARERDIVANALSWTTLAEKFAAFAAANEMPTESAARFAEVAAARNDVFHGRLPRVSSDLAVSAHKLAEDVLMAELGILGPPLRSRGSASVRGMNVHMTISGDDRGPIGRPDLTPSTPRKDDVPLAEDDVPS